MKQIKMKLNGLGCASCAAKIERESQSISGIENVVVDVSQSTLTATYRPSQEDLTQKLIDIVKRIEPHVQVEVDDEKSTSSSSHDHGHHHNKGELSKLLLALLLLALGIAFKSRSTLYISLLLSSYVLSGYKVLWRSIQNISRGQIFDEHFLMSIATLGAIAIGEYPEAVAVMIFYGIGEYFQSYAVNRSRNAISSLLDIRPDSANLIRGNESEVVAADTIKIGDIILVKPGERIPLDGIIIKGESHIDTSALTGESLPQWMSKSQPILSGSLVLDSALQIEVKQTFKNSTVSRILDLVQNATSQKAPVEKFITKFARYYTPVVVAAALALATIPPFLLNMGDFSTWLYRGLVFLVISCPCALVVSVPLTFFSGIGNASRQGILVKGSHYLEALESIDTVVFDKTGTLTEGQFEVDRVFQIHPEYPEESITKFAALAESQSNHPIAKSIVKHYGKAIEVTSIDALQEISGKGILADINEGQLKVGNAALMALYNIEIKAIHSPYTVIYVALNQVCIGAITVADTIKNDALETIQALKNQSIQTMMLTGDRKEVAKSVADTLHMDTYYSELLPEEKYNHVQKLIEQGHRVAFVGDGINDAPVLAGSTVGISMGGVGSDSAIEASDVVLMTDEPYKIVEAIKISKRTQRIVKENITLALGIKAIVMGLGVFGITTMWMAIFADVGVTLIAVINAMRALKNN